MDAPARGLRLRESAVVHNFDRVLVLIDARDRCDQVFTRWKRRSNSGFFGCGNTFGYFDRASCLRDGNQVNAFFFGRGFFELDFRFFFSGNFRARAALYDFACGDGKFGFGFGGG